VSLVTLIFIICALIILLYNPKLRYHVHKNLPIPRTCVIFRNKLFFFSRLGVDSPSPDPQVGWSPSVGGPRLLIQ